MTDSKLIHFASHVVSQNNTFFFCNRQVLAWQTSWWADKEHNIVPKGHVNDQLTLMLEELETILGVVQVQHALALLTCAKHGITDSEMIDLLAFDENFHSSTTYGKY